MADIFTGFNVVEITRKRPRRAGGTEAPTPPTGEDVTCCPQQPLLKGEGSGAAL